MKQLKNRFVPFIHCTSKIQVHPRSPMIFHSSPSWCNVMDLSHYDVLDNVSQRVENASNTLVHVEVGFEKWWWKSLWTHWERSTNVSDECITWEKRMSSAFIAYARVNQTYYSLWAAFSPYAELMHGDGITYSERLHSVLERTSTTTWHWI
jgi:hypothetical protein